MRLTQKEKLEMCIDHVKHGKSISQVCEEHGDFDKAHFKYLVNIYLKYGEPPFIDREPGVYKRDTKLLAISRVMSGESIRSVALDLGLIDPNILGDWVKKYKETGEASIQDTYPRKNYLNDDQRNIKDVDKKLLEENERLRAEIEYLKKSQSLTQKLEGVTNKEKSRIVTELRSTFKLEVLLEVSGLASSVYFYHYQEKPKQDRYTEIKDKIDDLYLNKHKKRQGYQVIYIELKKLGYKVGKNKVLEIMNLKGYIRKKKIRWKKYNSYEGDLGTTKPNLMNQDFKTEKPYQKAGTDITMFSLELTNAYFLPVIDFNSREILAYSCNTDAKVDKVLKMLKTLDKGHGPRIRGMMIQSDQGIQYQNSRYQERQVKLGIIQSMSRKGNCLDNSPKECLFARLKQEIWHGHESEYKTSEQLIKTIEDYVKYYNETRIVLKHKMSPFDYRQTMIK